MYERFYGLREKPFNIAPDPAYLYRSDIHREALANLTYAIREGTGFVVLTGEVGTGKTLILHTLLAELEDSVKSAYIFYPKITFRDMLRMILNELECPIRGENPSESDLLIQLNSFLIERFQKGLATVLIIDEAQDLSDDLLENIRLLSNLETSKSKLLTIILVGQPELHEQLERPELRQLRQRIVVRFHMSPLEKKEVHAYVHHRLRTAGAPDLELFNDRAISRIASYSEGIPRLINILCDNALLLGFAEEESVIGVSLIDEAIRDLEGGALATAPKRLAETVRRRSGSRRWQPVAVFVFVLIFISAAALAYSMNLFGLRSTLVPASPGGNNSTPAATDRPGDSGGTTPMPVDNRAAVLPPTAQPELASDIPVASDTGVNDIAVGDHPIADAGGDSPTNPTVPSNPPRPESAPTPLQVADSGTMRGEDNPVLPTATIELTATPTQSPALTATPTVAPSRTATPTASPTNIPTLAEGLQPEEESGSESGAATLGNEPERAATATPRPTVREDELEFAEVQIIRRDEGPVGENERVAIQVASFISPDRARASARLLEDLGAEALVASPLADETGINWIRVFAVDFESVDEAEAFLERTRNVRSISQAQPFVVIIEESPPASAVAGGREP